MASSLIRHRTSSIVMSAAVFLLVGAHTAMSRQQLATTPPNILLIQADDLGYGDLSAYGQSRFQTPSLDRMARMGIRFTHYYAGSTVCAPSRCVLMTGLHTGHAWIRGNGGGLLRDEDLTIAEVLKAAGYRTAVIGKWGLGNSDTPGQPDRQGFEYSFGFLNHSHAHRKYTDHLWRNAERIASDPDIYVNDLFTQEAIQFIELDASKRGGGGREDTRPFFVYLNYTVPHADMRAPEESVAAFRGRFPEKLAAFAGMITRMDRDIGRLLDVLRARGIEQRTLVLFISDNGPHRPDPVFFKSSGGLRGMKRDLYEGGIRVPMIAQWPGTIPAGRVSDHVWAHWDVFPTLADVAGAPIPPALDGIPMTRALRGEPQSTHQFFYWEFHERGFQQAVRMGHWKAVRLKAGAPLELYDLAADPLETTNIAASRSDLIARIENYLRTARTDSVRWPATGHDAKPKMQPEKDHEAPPRRDRPK